jgi:hypothetical protein
VIAVAETLLSFVIIPAIAVTIVASFWRLFDNWLSQRSWFWL